MHFTLSSSSTCCDTDLERSSCAESCCKKKLFDSLKSGKKRKKLQIKMLDYKKQNKKKVRKCKLLHLLCMYRVQGGLRVPLTP